MSLRREIKKRQEAIELKKAEVRFNYLALKQKIGTPKVILIAFASSLVLSFLLIPKKRMQTTGGPQTSRSLRVRLTEISSVIAILLSLAHMTESLMTSVRKLEQ